MDFNKDDLTKVEGSNVIAGTRFTARNDYEMHLVQKGVISNPEELWLDEQLVVAVQQNWHSRGQNGCRFAQYIAINAEELGWSGSVVFGKPEDLDISHTAQRIEERIQSAVKNENEQVMSLLFPQVTTPEELVSLVKLLVQVPCINMVRNETIGSLNAVALRIGLAENTVQAWLMGFGPFDFFPLTRKAPVTEVSIRTKVKPEHIFHRLSQDREVAHLADTPTGMTEGAIERRWQGTYRNTRNILGKEPDQFSAAKVTFAIPTDLLQNQ